MYNESDKERFSRIFDSLQGKGKPFDLPSSRGFGDQPPKFDLSLLEDFGISKAESIVSRGRNRVVGINIEAQQGFDRLNILQVWGAKLAMASIQMAVSFGYLDPDKIKRIADFGAGAGGPTFALVVVARQLGATVNAIEQHDKSADQIVETGILPAESVIKVDGIDYLGSLEDIGIERYDLVTAYMLGPDTEGELFRKLARASNRALNPEGNLLVTSDGGTIESVREVCQTVGVLFNRIQGVSDGKEVVVPTTIVVPHASCEAIGLSSPRKASKSPFAIDFTKGNLFDKKFSLFDPDDKYLK